MSLKDVFIDGVLLQSIGVAGLLFTRKKTAHEPLPPTPSVTEADSLSACDARERLRRRHSVRLVSAEEEGSGAARVSNGTYGFTFAPLGEAPLFAKPAHHAYEIHRLPGGEVRLIAFVPPADAVRIREGREQFEARIYPDAFGDAVDMVAIPVERLRAHKLVPSREPGNWIAVTVYPS
jgi:hypothetical protein